MKVTRRGTDLECEFSIYADRSKCDEYMLPKQTSNLSANPIKECYVVVREGQTIVVSGNLSGHLTRARFDLIADGSFIGSRLVLADKSNNVKRHTRRKIEFATINTVVDVDDEEDENARPAVIDAELMTKNLEDGLPPHVLSGEGQVMGVGSLMLIISIEQSFSQQGYAPEPNDFVDRTLGNWEYRPLEVGNPGITPTHSLVACNIESKVLPQKGNKFLQQFYDDRYGMRPFAKLIFYYRSKTAIAQAYCMPLPQRAYPVGVEYEEPEPITSDIDEGDELEEEDTDQSLFVTAAPFDFQKPRRRLGGTLRLSEDDAAEVNNLAQFAQQQMAERKRRVAIDRAGVSDQDRHQDKKRRLEPAEELVAAEAGIYAHDNGQEQHHAHESAPGTIRFGDMAYHMPHPDDFLAWLKQGAPTSTVLGYWFPGVGADFKEDAVVALFRHVRVEVEIRESAGQQYWTPREEHTIQQSCIDLAELDENDSRVQHTDPAGQLDQSQVAHYDVDRPTVIEEYSNATLPDRGCSPADIPAVSPQSACPEWQGRMLPESSHTGFDAAVQPDDVLERGRGARLPCPEPISHEVQVSSPDASLATKLEQVRATHEAKKAQLVKRQQMIEERRQQKQQQGIREAEAAMLAEIEELERDNARMDAETASLADHAALMQTENGEDIFIREEDVSRSTEAVIKPEQIQQLPVRPDSGSAERVSEVPERAPDAE